MARRRPLGRTHEEEQPASTPVSQLLVIGFLIAALLGLLIGVVWVSWNLLRNHFPG